MYHCIAVAVHDNDYGVQTSSLWNVALVRILVTSDQVCIAF